MFDDEVGLSNVQRKQFACGKLVIEPIDGAILQVSERIMSCRARQFVFAQHHLFLPGIELIGGFFRWFAADPVAAFERLPSVTPSGYSLRVDHLSLHMESPDEESISLVFQVLEDRPRVLSHENRMRRIVMNTELIAHTMLLANAVQRDPGAGR